MMSVSSVTKYDAYNNARRQQWRMMSTTICDVSNNVGCQLQFMMSLIIRDSVMLK